LCFNQRVAKRIITQLVDDTTGEDIKPGKGETVDFALDGQAYTIDLTTKNADAFRGLFQDYVAAATRVGRKGNRSSKRNAANPTSEVREWARSNGWPDLGNRGRIPADVQTAFNAR
jgi:Lsr2